MKYSGGKKSCIDTYVRILQYMTVMVFGVCGGMQQVMVDNVLLNPISVTVAIDEDLRKSLDVELKSIFSNQLSIPSVLSSIVAGYAAARGGQFVAYMNTLDTKDAVSDFQRKKGSDDILKATFYIIDVHNHLPKVFTGQFERTPSIRRSTIELDEEQISTDLRRSYVGCVDKGYLCVKDSEKFVLRPQMNAVTLRVLRHLVGCNMTLKAIDSPEMMTARAGSLLYMMPGVSEKLLDLLQNAKVYLNSHDVSHPLSLMPQRSGLNRRMHEEARLFLQNYSFAARTIDALMKNKNGTVDPIFWRGKTLSACIEYVEGLLKK